MSASHLRTSLSPSTENLDATFAALGHTAGRAILGRLMEGASKLFDLAEPFNISQTAVSNHVRVLSDAGFLTVEKRGRTRHCRLNAEPMKQATDWLNDYQVFWTG